MQVVSARVTEPVGFHARPAAVAVTQAGRFKCSVELRYKDRTADMKSIIQIMKMGIPWDAQIEICCAGSLCYRIGKDDSFRIENGGQAAVRHLRTVFSCPSPSSKLVAQDVSATITFLS